MSSRKASALHRQRRFLSGCVACVFAFGILAAPTPKHEIFPFFCWFLFSITPGPGTHYAIEITHRGDTPLASPQTFQGSSLVQSLESRTNADRIIQNLGEALEIGDREALEQFRDLLENNYFREPVGYRIVRHVRDPLIYLQTGREEKTVLANFHWEGEP